MAAEDAVCFQSDLLVLGRGGVDEDGIRNHRLPVPFVRGDRNDAVRVLSDSLTRDMEGVDILFLMSDRGPGSTWSVLS